MDCFHNQTEKRFLCLGIVVSLLIDFDHIFIFFKKSNKIMLNIENPDIPEQNSILNQSSHEENPQVNSNESFE
jgi:hypothetical protein